MGMTAVLWIEEPKTCDDCPCMVQQWDGDALSRKRKRICQVKGKSIHTKTNRPRWCQLMILDINLDSKK